MLNHDIQGGIVVADVPLESGGEAAPERSLRIYQASQDLREMIIDRNLANAALLDANRRKAESERQKAEAIHSLKRSSTQSIHELYFKYEPALISAIKRGERSEARKFINYILVNIYSVGRHRRDLLKSHLLELVVIMSRAAVEAGAHPDQVLGLNFQRLVQLADINDEEQLSEWLKTMLEQIMDAIRDHTQFPNSALLSEVIEQMQANLHQNLKRGEIAKAVGLSSSSLCNLLKDTLGQSFTCLLRQYRIQRARELLTLTEKSLVQIALECGFCDQSYFTNVFSKEIGLSPGEYRRDRTSG